MLILNIFFALFNINWQKLQKSKKYTLIFYLSFYIPKKFLLYSRLFPLINIEWLIFILIISKFAHISNKGQFLYFYMWYKIS